MKKLILMAIVFLLTIAPALADRALVVERYSSDGIVADDRADGIVIYFTAAGDATEYNYTRPLTTTDGIEIEIPMSILNLDPEIEYTFWATTFNSHDESVRVGPVVGQYTGFVPPETNLPTYGATPPETGTLTIESE